MIEEVKTKTFFIWQNFGLCTVLPLDGLMGRWLDFRRNKHPLVLFVLCVCNKLKGSSRCQRRLATINIVCLRLLSILVPQHTCNVETCLRLYYMAVSIFCSALYTTDTSQITEYTLNELTGMHLLYGETLGNSRAARLLYAERFPMRLPSHVLFQRIDARIRETEHVGPTRRGAGRPRNVRRNMSKWTTANGNRHVSTM